MRHIATLIALAVLAGCGLPDGSFPEQRPAGGPSVVVADSTTTWVLDAWWGTQSLRAVKCSGLGGAWVVERTGTQPGVGKVHTIVRTKIDPATLRGPFVETGTIHRTGRVIRVSFAGTAVIDMRGKLASLRLDAVAGSSPVAVDHLGPLPLQRTAGLC